MKIRCNGEERELSGELLLGVFLDELGLDPLTVVVECDGRILPRDEYACHRLRDGSVLELIRFVGGG